MYFVLKSNFKIFTFQQNKYSDIVDKIKESRFFIEYIDHANKVRENNPRYNRYLDYKYYIYSKYLEGLDIEKSISTEIDDKIAKRIYESYFKDDPNIDDYCLGDSNLRILIEPKADEIDLEFIERKKIQKTTEDLIYGYSVSILKQRENFKIDHFKEGFLDNNHMSFILPSFLTKDNNCYLKPIITLNIYSCGLIILEVTYMDEENDKLIYDDQEQVMNKSFENVKVHKIKSKYTFKDFFKSVNIKSANIHDVVDYYYNMIRKISGSEIYKHEKDFFQYSTSITKFKGASKKHNNKEFLNNNRDEIVTFMNNTYLAFTKSMSDKDKIVEKFDVLERKPASVYCNDKTMFQYFDSSYIDKALKENNGGGNEAGKDLLDKRKDVFLNTSLANLEVFRIAMLNKFFYKNKYLEVIKLLKDAEPDSLINIDNLNKEIQLYKYNYNKDMIFQVGTTTTEMYINILDKLDPDDYEFKVKNKIERIENSNQKLDDVGARRKGAIIAAVGVLVAINYKWINDFLRVLLAKSNISIINNHPLRTLGVVWILLMTLSLVILKKYLP